MRAAYVIPGMRGAGGAERSLAAMAPYLRHDVDLHVLTFTGRDGLRSELEDAGATLHDVGSGNRWQTVTRLSQQIARLSPDVVHTTLVDADLVGRLAALRRRTPVVTSLVNVNHGIDRIGRTPTTIAKRSASWAADAVTARSVVKFHALTNHVATTMSRRLCIPTSRIEVIPRGRDPESLGRRTAERRAAARQDLGISGDVPLVIAAARHEEQKGFDVLLEAMALVRSANPAAKLLIGGREGRYTGALEGIVERHSLGDIVTFIGQRDDLPELMCAADVWCVPSRWEGLGSILLEAMALEVPVVASDIPPIAEVAGTPPTLSLVPVGEPTHLAAAIGRVLDQPSESERRAAQARERFLQHFTAEEVARRMVEFYEQALAASRFRTGS